MYMIDLKVVEDTIIETYSLINLLVDFEMGLVHLLKLDCLFDIVLPLAFIESFLVPTIFASQLLLALMI